MNLLALMAAFFLQDAHPGNEWLKFVPEPASTHLEVGCREGWVYHNHSEDRARSIEFYLGSTFCQDGKRGSFELSWERHAAEFNDGDVKLGIQAFRFTVWWELPDLLVPGLNADFGFGLGRDAHIFTYSGSLASRADYRTSDLELHFRAGLAAEIWKARLTVGLEECLLQGGKHRIEHKGSLNYFALSVGLGVRF